MIIIYQSFPTFPKFTLEHLYVYVCTASPTKIISPRMVSDPPNIIYVTIIICETNFKTQSQMLPSF